MVVELLTLVYMILLIVLSFLFLLTTFNGGKYFEYLNYEICVLLIKGRSIIRWILFDGRKDLNMLFRFHGNRWGCVHLLELESVFAIVWNLFLLRDRQFEIWVRTHRLMIFWRFVLNSAWCLQVHRGTFIFVVELRYDEVWLMRRKFPIIHWVVC